MKKQLPSRSGRVGHRVVLLAALILAAALRLAWPERAPAGMNSDEVATAWNGWCLAQAGRDQHGVRWPVAYSHGYGQGTTTLYLYSSVPFYRALGLTAAAARLPAALGGVLTVALLYYIGMRLFSPAVGNIAAILLAVTPWHLQQSRWGHEAS